MVARYPVALATSRADPLEKERIERERGLVIVRGQTSLSNVSEKPRSEGEGHDASVQTPLSNAFPPNSRFTKASQPGSGPAPGLDRGDAGLARRYILSPAPAEGCRVPQPGRLARLATE